MPLRPTRRQIADEDRAMLARQARFRRAADAVAAALAAFPEVRAISLFGSVARPLYPEVPRFQPFKRYGIEVLHECKDVDIAVWIDSVEALGEINRARNKAVSLVRDEKGGGVAHHETDVFLLEPATNRYLGRLCTFGACPKGKAECLVPGCGREAFLRQHEDFVFFEEALAADRVVPLFDRASGLTVRAADLERPARGAAQH